MDDEFIYIGKMLRVLNIAPNFESGYPKKSWNSTIEFYFVGLDATIRQIRWGFHADRWHVVGSPKSFINDSGAIQTNTYPTLTGCFVRLLELKGYSREIINDVRDIINEQKQAEKIQCNS